MLIETNDELFDTFVDPDGYINEELIIEAMGEDCIFTMDAVFELCKIVRRRAFSAGSIDAFNAVDECYL
jgi:hypothetical protein